MSAVIEHLEVTPLAFADPPLLNADGVHQPEVLRALLRLHVRTPDGASVIGLGECTGHSWQLDYLEHVGAALVGLSVADPQAMRAIVVDWLRGGDAHGHLDGRWADRSDSVDSRGPAPLPAGAFDVQRVHSAIEVAMLDAHGRVLGVPVVDLLGGAVRARVPFSAYLFYQWGEHPATSERGPLGDAWGPALDPDGIVTQAQRMVREHGFASLKLKGGVMPPEEEIAALRALRAAFPEHPLRLDPNAAWTTETTLRHLDELAGLLEYLEDPVPGVEEMGVVASRRAVPLATNMIVVGDAGVLPALRAGAIDVLLGDHHYWGGLRGADQLGAVSRASGWGLSMHSNSHLGVSMAAMVAAAAATPEVVHDCDTHLPWVADDDIVTAPVRFSGGAVEVSRDPGLGVTLDQTQVARLAQRYTEVRREHRADQSYRRSVEPDFDHRLPRW